MSLPPSANQNQAFSSIDRSETAKRKAFITHQLEKSKCIDQVSQVIYHQVLIYNDDHDDDGLLSACFFLLFSWNTVRVLSLYPVLAQFICLASIFMIITCAPDYWTICFT